jgi:fructose-bisphosphate aldolase class I
MTDLPGIASELLAKGKGILAADESVGSADKRLALYGIEGSPETRRQFRDLFLAAPGIEEYLSGVILHEETLDQKANDGTGFPELLTKRGIIPGIKVDQGTEPMPESPDELITKGLIGLPERLAAFTRHPVGFTKWRAVVTIDGDRLPSASAIVENAKRLASYACEVQRAGMVPILEPEVLLDGKHSRLKCREVMETAIGALMSQLLEQCADPSGVILKTSEDTVGALMKAVPKELAGIVFLSGGQTPDQATENLAAITHEARKKGAPWPLTFSFARALQEEALAAWAGKEENVPAAREAFLKRLKATADALA